MTTRYRPGDEFIGILERVWIRWNADDQALYYAARDFLRDSTQPLEEVADRYAEEYGAIVWPDQIEELAGELYAREQVMTYHSMRGEGEE